MKFNFLSVLLLLILAYFVSPFFSTIFSSALLAYITFPLFKKINIFIKNKEVSAFISTIIALTFFSIIFYSFFMLIQFMLSNVNLFFINIDFENLIGADAQPIFNPSLLSNDSALQPKQLLDTILMVFLIFYFLSESSNVFGKIIKQLSKNDEMKLKALNEKMGLILKSILKNFLKAMLFGAAAYILLLAISMNNAFELSVIILASSLIPSFNAGIIIFIIAGYELLNHSFLTAFLLLLIAIAFTLFHHYFDSIFRLKKDINPLVFFSGIMVGAFSFGVFGFIAGPVLAGFIQAVFETISE
ncbi:MAG: AI-2E family transporter [Candidatus Nanoarchaeia archaeon]|nr:AI-2E family transporter [Candidatus Nanoarchaeia archaeon]